MVHGQNEVILLITALDLLFLLQLAKCWTLKLFQKPVVCAYKRSQVWLKTSLNSGTKLIIVKALIKAPAQVWRWNVPKGYFIRYMWMISDGNSKAYNAIWSIYGACDTCHHYENLQNSDQEYVIWKASEGFEKWEEDHLAGTAGCDRVMKLDCIGHVQKRLWKAFYEFQKSSVKLKDVKPIYGRNGRLKRLQSRNWKRIMARQFVTM